MQTAIITEVGEVTIDEEFGLAGQVIYTLTYADGTHAQIVGTIYGSPGPVHLLMQQWVDQFLVVKAERFGEKFDRQWVERYITGREIGAEVITAEVIESQHYLPEDDDFTDKLHGPRNPSDYLPPEYIDATDG